MTNVYETIKKFVEENDVAIFMKGTPDFPACGFSGMAVTILHRLNVQFAAINVLEDDEIRQAIKEYSDWPTIPQIYVKGEFIGGSDILRELYENGELETLFKEKHIL